MNNADKLISTQLHVGQGLGNQLWVYAASRSIAEYLGFPFYLSGTENFKGKDFLNISSIVGTNKFDAESLIKNSSFKIFNETTYYDSELKYFSSGFDSRVMSINGPTQLEGLFQSESYFFEDIFKLRQYLPVNQEFLSENKVDSDVVILNIRGGEYKRHSDLILPKSYWENAIENIKEHAKVENFLIVTDDYRYARSLFPKYEVLQGGVGDCYATLYNASYLILSNSSFGYFPVKTGGNAKFVIAPKHWARFGNSYGRWASVGNCYKDWHFQDINGALTNYVDCLPIIQTTENYYEYLYSVRIPQTQIPGKPLRRFIPKTIRQLLKKTLGWFFPRWIG